MNPSHDPESADTRELRPADRSQRALVAEVLQLLEWRQSAAIPGWLYGQLTALFPGTEGRVLQVFPPSALRRAERVGETAAVVDLFGDPTPQPSDSDEMLSEVIQTRRTVSVRTARGARLLVPLVAGGEVRYVVEVVGAIDHAERSPLLASLLPIVSRYFDLLVDAETDTLTRLANRRVFVSQVAERLGAWVRGPRRFYLAVADIDHFKRINDRLGHLGGDEILVRFAELMRHSFRAGDLLYRYGGEEFLVVFGVASPEDGARVLDRFREMVATHEFPGGEHVTVSQGLASITDPSLPLTTLIDRADRALYFAKSNGRNRVCSYEQLVDEGVLVPLGAKPG